MLMIVNLVRILKFFKKIEWKGLTGAIIILIILSMMILPLPSFILDLCFTFNIVISIMILLVTMFTCHVLEFSVFPSILLFSTLFRLSLNIASTRIILLKGHLGSYAVGHIIEAFGHFLVGGDFIIGIIIFLILIIINFIVITKGSNRIAEVSARFALDGMPGKQMAIDSDVNAGLINEQQAKKSRMEVSQESDFYGAMDGASKFVRGDAIASILIMIINLIGGLIVGTMKHNMSMLQAGQTYTLLTIGDGLVAQIPALVISTAAGVIVTRVSTTQNISEQIINQIFYDPKIVLISGAFLGVFGLIPGMPNLIFLFCTGILIIISMILYFCQGDNLNNSMIEPNTLQNNNKSEIFDDMSLNQLALEDLLKLELHYLLVPMINIKNSNNLFHHIFQLRKYVAQTIGFVPEMVHIQNNENLSPSYYRILIKGVEYGTGMVHIDKYLAINMGNATEALPGNKTIDPIFQFTSFWISNDLVHVAQQRKYNVLTPEMVVVTHLQQIVFSNLQNLFGRQEMNQLLEYISFRMPKIVEEIIPSIITVTNLHKILQNLLLENIPIRDMRTILETILEYGSIYKDPDELTSLIRLSLNGLITQIFCNSHDKIYVMGIESKLEDLFFKIMKSGNSFIEQNLQQLFLKSVSRAMNQQKKHSPDYLILIVRHSIRMFIARFLKQYFVQLVVLSNLEILDNKIIVVTDVISVNTNNDK